MNDNRGFFEIFDGLIAIIILLFIFLMFNLVLTLPNNQVSTTTHEFKDSQDVMEQLSAKTNITDESFLEEITEVLKEGRNSKKSLREVSSMCEKKFKTLGLEGTYYFTETNYLNGDKIVSSGNINSVNNVTIASRHCRDYCYVLRISYD